MTAVEAKRITMEVLYNNNKKVIDATYVQIRESANKGETSCLIFPKLNGGALKYLRDSEGYTITDGFPDGSRVFWG